MWVGCDADGAVCTQGLVTTLHEGEDFGQLALLNDAPRAATIILREDNCHFLRVDKQDFIRILKVSLTGPLLNMHCINAAGPIPQPFVSSFRMLKRTQCDLRSTGRLCWCWRRAPTGPSREERETTASEKLLTHTHTHTHTHTPPRQYRSLHKQVHNHKDTSPGWGQILCHTNNTNTAAGHHSTGGVECTHLFCRAWLRSY